MSVAMFSAISGLANFQRMLDVVANNISNANTPGFKASRVRFQEHLSQTLRSATALTESRGGRNPMQIGLGSLLGAIERLWTDGNLELTGKRTDLAITGNGFFLVKDGEGRAYTRNGSFDVDAGGYLVDSEGRRVQGWPARNGVVDPNVPPVDLQISLNETMTARATSRVTFAGNLDGSAPLYDPGPPESGGAYTVDVTLYDSLGQDYTVQMKFTRSGISTWEWHAWWEGTDLGSGTVAFDASGHYDPAGSTLSPSFTLQPAGGADPVTVTPDFSALTQLVTPGSYSVVPARQDGYPAGTLQTFTIDQNAVLQGSYSNGLSQPLGQVALAAFANPAGLEKTHSGLYLATGNSGDALIGPPGTGPRGTVTARALEMSNVDLSDELTRMIIAQRAFQANARVITTMDEVFGEIANLKR